jgi:RNA polymerase sigma-54 factor
LLIDSNSCPRCFPPETKHSEDPIVFISPIQDFYHNTASNSLEIPDDNLPASEEDLPTYVLRQIAFELRPEDRLLAAHILSSLDEDGLLGVPLAEIALYHHVSFSRLESILQLIQRADPVGVGAPSPREALLVQLDVLAESRPVPPLAYAAIREGMDMLSRHQYSELGHLIGVSTRQVEQIARFIADNLNPYPARAFWGDIHQGKGEAPNVYSSPDVIISCLDSSPNSPFLVEIVSPYAGMLRVNSLFRSSIDQAPEEKSDQWRSDLERAELLVKCLQQRTNTIVRLCSRLALFQRDYILFGDEHLKPLTRAVLAEELQVHESTISRAVSSKAVQLPNGRIVPLARFFDRSLHIRTVLKQIIEQEKIPLSDSELVELLNRQGYTVARRTVAKYRAMEGILPSHLRQSPVPLSPV